VVPPAVAAVAAPKFVATPLLSVKMTWLSAAALKPVPVRVKAKLAVPAVLVAGAMLVNVAAVVVNVTGAGEVDAAPRVVTETE
jgi:hypothetical protein